MDNKYDVVFKGELPNLKELEERGCDLGSGGRRFWFNVRAMLSITRTSIAEFARRIGANKYSISSKMYLADTRGDDCVMAMTAFAASDVFGVPTDFFLHADAGRLCNVAQLKRFEFRGTGKAPVVDPYRLSYMDLLGKEDGLEIVKLAYEAAGFNRQEIESVISRVLATKEVIDESGIPDKSVVVVVKEKE